ncbi:hypothetical protein CB1_001891011 [Camelus ferus]|nr:hypothetical protein CB1_001891011 [Camelus ferus]
MRHLLLPQGVGRQLTPVLVPFRGLRRGQLVLAVAVRCNVTSSSRLVPWPGPGLPWSPASDGLDPSQASESTHEDKSLCTNEKKPLQGLNHSFPAFTEKRHQRETQNPAPARWRPAHAAGGSELGARAGPAGARQAGS